MKHFKVKKRDDGLDRFLRRIVRIFKRKPRIVDLNGNPVKAPYLMIGNHNGAGGAFSFRTFLKRHRFMCWGAHPMVEGFRSRWRYLYRIFYRQKLHYSKLRAFLTTLVFCPIAGLAYRFCGIIPVYYDMRISRTFQYSLQCLEEGVGVFVFPEDSTDGYKELPEQFLPGFLNLARFYERRTGKELPICTCFYQRIPKRIIVDTPVVLSALAALTEDEKLAYFRQRMMKLREDWALQSTQALDTKLATLEATHASPRC
ncbi:MAG: hypothetical protein LBM78_04350 [Clostridiales bacterium]|jgi:hypothetical protein|nr:hypothetical protein [Clostridiales bacterium]